jgi:hypothetical protein
MKKTMSSAIALVFLLALQITLVRTARAQDVDANKENKGKTTTIHGYVRDVACLMRHPDALNPTNECALECAKGGSPIFIVTKDGALYLPISGTLPDTSQQERLMPYVGKYVEAKGLVFERSGLKAIDVHDIHIADEKK